MITEDIADFVATFDLKSAPADLLPRVRETFLDSFGVMLAGSREESAQLAARWVRSQGAKGDCRLFADAGFVRPPQTPRWPTAWPRIPLTTIISAIRAPLWCLVFWPPGEAKGVSGRDLIEAYVVGVEVSTLLANGMGEEAKSIGLHPAGLCGTLGATAAAAKILHLTRQQIQVALGIAASMTSGLSQNFGTMVKPLHLGNAARNGIMAAELAAIGFTANAEYFRRARWILRRAKCSRCE